MVKVNLHQISYKLPWCNQTLLRVKCHLLPFRLCIATCLIDSRELSVSTQTTKQAQSAA